MHTDTMVGRTFPDLVAVEDLRTELTAISDMAAVFGQMLATWQAEGCAPAFPVTPTSAIARDALHAPVMDAAVGWHWLEDRMEFAA